MRNKCKHKNTKALSVSLMWCNQWEWCTDCGATKMEFMRDGKFHGKWKSPKIAKLPKVIH